MRRYSTLWASVLLAALLFGGCAPKQFGISEPRHITLKTRLLKFNDIGYLRESGDAVQLELFAAGQAVETFTIDGKVCVQAGCLPKERFNAEYLSPSYPDELLQNVLLARPIFEGRSRVQTMHGFEQEVMGKGYDITYRVTGETVYFKDHLNGILIKMRPLPR